MKFKNKIVAISLAGAVTFLVFLPALRNEFVLWDDGDYAYANSFIRSFNLTFFRWAFTAFHASNWHPLTWISHALDYAIWGLDPLGHHLTNNILHTINTVLVVLLVVRLVESWKNRWVTNEGPSFLSEQGIWITALVTGLLFGLHPLHVESVAWVSERKDLLCALFFLLSVMAYMSYRFHMTYKTYIFSLCFFVLALMSKPMAVSLPVIFLLLDWYPFGRISSIRTFRDASIEKLPFLALSIGSSILTILAQKGAMRMMEYVPLPARLMVAAKALIAYLWNMLLPIDLVPYYPYPQAVSILSSGYLVALFLVLGITAASILVVRRQRIWMAAWGYFVITLVPVLGIVQVGGQAMADRYTYLPSLAPFLMTGLLAAWISGKMNALQKWAMPLKFFGAVAAVLVFISLAFLTSRQIEVWKNSLNLWNYVIAKEPGIFIAYHNRAYVFREKGLFEKSVEDYSRAIALNPTYYDAYNNRGIVYEKMGQYDMAMDDFNKAISLKPSYHDAYNSRGLIYEKMGRLDAAMEEYRKAIALNPDYYEAYNNLGVAYAKLGHTESAIESFSKAAAIDSNNSRAYANLALAYSLINRQDKALENYVRAIKLDPTDSKAHHGLGSTYMKLGRLDDAIASFTNFVTLSPNDPEAYRNRGIAYATKGDFISAGVDFRKACSLGSQESCNYLQDPRFR